MSSAPRVSTSSESDSGNSSPYLSPLESAPLILVPDSHDPIDTAFDFSSDSEDEEMFDPPFDGQHLVVSLPPLAVFLYLLSPLLKFGAMFIPNAGLSIKQFIPPLLFFAVLTAFSRHILYLLARYLRKTDLDDIVSNIFARGRENEDRRHLLRNISSLCTGILRVLLGTVYLRESFHIILSILPEALYFPSRLVVGIAVALFVVPLSAVYSLAAKPIIFITWSSILTYVLWLACASYANSQGTLVANPSWLPPGTLWQGTTIIAFAFASSSPLHLYASLKTSVRQPAVRTRTPRSRSFRTLSTLSVSVALLLILPLAFFSFLPDSQDVPSESLRQFMAWLNAITLLLSLPSIIITMPSLLPARLQTSVKCALSKAVVYLVMYLLSLSPSRISGVLDNVLLVFALSATYFLPAFLHITVHQFSRPLTIVAPNNDSERPPSPSQDELLRRKERALQKRRRMKRILWDVGVWILFVPLGGCGFIWAAGKLAGRW